MAVSINLVSDSMEMMSATVAFELVRKKTAEGVLAVKGNALMIA